MNLNKFKQKLGRQIAEPNHVNGTCIACHEPFSNKNVFTQEGWRETKISQMCEKCWDNLFTESR